MSKIEVKTDFFINSLLEWGGINLRRFPWRVTENPYLILIAEILLQRTKGIQVLPVYREFISIFPDIHALNKASTDNILKIIKSLGLFKRAEGLKRLSEAIVTNYNGEIPRDKQELMALPYIGQYTADALLCHAYGEKVPTYDSNFASLIDRYFSLSLKPPKQKDISGYHFANELLKNTHVNSRILNLSIIDFSSSICRPRRPLCRICHLSSFCSYYNKVSN